MTNKIIIGYMDSTWETDEEEEWWWFAGEDSRNTVGVLYVHFEPNWYDDEDAEEAWLPYTVTFMVDAIPVGPEHCHYETLGEAQDVLLKFIEESRQKAPYIFESFPLTLS